jgi:hypothetical protein
MNTTNFKPGDKVLIYQSVAEYDAFEQNIEDGKTTIKHFVKIKKPDGYEIKKVDKIIPFPDAPPQFLEKYDKYYVFSGNVTAWERDGFLIPVFEYKIPHDVFKGNEYIYSTELKNYKVIENPFWPDDAVIEHLDQIAAEAAPFKEKIEELECEIEKLRKEVYKIELKNEEVYKHTKHRFVPIGEEEEIGKDGWGTRCEQEFECELTGRRKTSSYHKL